MRTIKAIERCAEWLVYCLSIGYKKSQLDRLEGIWWEHHNEKGELI